jgi:hypothetical protein
MPEHSTSSMPLNQKVYNVTYGKMNSLSGVSVTDMGLGFSSTESSDDLLGESSDMSIIREPGLWELTSDTVFSPGNIGTDISANSTLVVPCNYRAYI